MEEHKHEETHNKEAHHHSEHTHPAHHHGHTAHRDYVVKKRKSPVGRYIIAGLAFVAIVAAIVFLIMFFSKNAAKDEVAAVVNGEKLTVAYLDEQYSKVPAAYQQYITKEMMLNQSINEMLLMQEAKKQGITVTDAEVSAEIEKAMESANVTAEQLEERLAEQNLTRAFLEEMYQKQLTINKLLEKKVFPGVKVTEEEVSEFYDSRVHAAHILVAEESEAKDIIAQLSKVSKSKLASTFMDLAKELSTDPSAAENGGDLGEFGQGQMVKEFEEAAFALSENAYTKVPVKTQFGYHVILRLPKEETLEEQYSAISEYLLTQKKAQAVPLYIEKLRSSADIEVLYAAE